MLYEPRTSTGKRGEASREGEAYERPHQGRGHLLGTRVLLIAQEQRTTPPNGSGFSLHAQRTPSRNTFFLQPKRSLSMRSRIMCDTDSAVSAALAFRSETQPQPSGVPASPWAPGAVMRGTGMLKFISGWNR